MLAAGKLPHYSGETAGLEADILLGFVLRRSRAMLFAHGEDQVPGEEAEIYRSLVSRRRHYEPIAQILGHKEFFGHDFLVNPEVLTPRPETELVVERALSWFSLDCPPVQLVDVGTGSGAIILSILSALRDSFHPGVSSRVKAWATDLSPAALRTARENAQRLKLANAVTFVECDLFAGVPYKSGSEVLEILVSNPPYIPDSFPLPPDVEQFEPRSALRAGPKGLDVIARLLDQAAPRIASGAVLIMEIGSGQRLDVESLLKERRLDLFTFFRDLSGVDRVLEVCQRSRVGSNVV